MTLEHNGWIMDWKPTQHSLNLIWAVNIKKNQTSTICGSNLFTTNRKPNFGKWYEVFDSNTHEKHNTQEPRSGWSTWKKCTNDFYQSITFQSFFPINRQQYWWWWYRVIVSSIGTKLWKQVKISLKTIWGWTQRFFTHKCFELHFKCKNKWVKMSSGDYLWMSVFVRKCYLFVFVLSKSEETIHKTTFKPLKKMED